MEFWYFINILCVFVSWHYAMVAFNDGLKFSGYLNLFASALNAAIVANHFF